MTSPSWSCGCVSLEIFTLFECSLCSCSNLHPTDNRLDELFRDNVLSGSIEDRLVIDRQVSETFD